MHWIYEQNEFTDEMIGDAVGFVYLITNLSNGKKYVGKKNFTKSKTYQKNKKKKRKRVASDWQDYYGSSEAVALDVLLYGKHCFRREIIRLCYSKAEMSYFEAYEQFVRHAIVSDEYYNDWLAVRVRRAHLRKLKDKISC